MVPLKLEIPANEPSQVSPTSPTDTMQFNLLGIILHHGPAANQGHYTCVAKRGDNWWHMDDDQEVTPIENIEVFLGSTETMGKATLMLYEYDKYTPPNPNGTSRTRTKGRGARQRSRVRRRPRRA